MKNPIITRLPHPLKQEQRMEIADLLAAAFSEDQGMIDLIGRRRWSGISTDYFSAQLSHPDLVLTAALEGTTVGTLIATTPDARFSLTAAVRTLFSLKRLLKNQYAASQQIADRIAEQIPRVMHTYINQVAVLPEYQGQGIGQKLLTALLNECIGIPVYVDCHASLEPFYTCSGFDRVAAINESDLLVLAAQSDGP